MLSVRLAGRGGLREGVPSAPRQPLRDWILRQTYQYDTMVERVQRRLELVREPTRMRHRLVSGLHTGPGTGIS